MEKDFDRWNSEKKRIEYYVKNKFYHSREIWWCTLGLNVGTEQDGKEEFKRPVLIIKAFGSACLVVPLTTSKQKHMFRFSLGVIQDRETSAMLSQLRVVDTKRFVQKMAVLEKSKFEAIRKSIKDML